ncbi:hypothetical protein V6N12_071883 [Hibiscus sabdariffa]|uniref:Uncharacterized protein n=1 Tax=Hibiscus sabdariffa TaxID=183260 RepID=A0ABR2FL33_9ROSI
MPVEMAEDVTTSIDGAHVEIDSSPKQTRAAAKGPDSLVFLWPVLALLSPSSMRNGFSSSVVIGFNF